MTISLTSTQLDAIKRSVRSGLQVFIRPEPITLAAWADEHFYISKETSSLEGEWRTLPFQVAMFNAIGHDDIIYVNIIKSARVGYSQMLRAAMGYFTSHKSRHIIIYQPTDTKAKGFMKTHVETMIRDVPEVKKLAPWLGKKHRDSTLDTKVFANGKNLWCLGGTSPDNYREKSSDVVLYDELSAFDHDIGGDGNATTLGDKRFEVSVFPKSVRGSSPKITGTCQISKAASEAEMLFKFHVPCPHCAQEQVLKWGGEDSSFGFKWIDGDPKTVKYLCEYCGALIDNSSLTWMSERGVWRDEAGNWTQDGIKYFAEDGARIDPPESIAFHIWTAYSPFTTWARIVSTFIKAKDDQSKLKTFVNTTLGETWDEDVGEKIEPNHLYMRREHYRAEVPVDHCILTAAVDTQDDRLEIDVVAWTAGEESYRVSYDRLYGDLSRSEIWDSLARHLKRQFRTPDGALLDIKLVFIDSGGHYTDEVYQFCKKHGSRRFVPVKGHSQANKPIATWPRKKNEKGVYLTMIGSDTAKEIITDRLRIMEPGEGYMHWPVSEQFDEEYFKQLTNERKVMKFIKGRRAIVWDAGGRRQEPFDTAVYNLAAIRVLQQHFGIRLKSLEAIQAAEDAPTPAPARQPRFRFGARR